MSEPLHQLNTEDQRVFDALVEAGFELASLPAGDRPRAEKLMELMGLLDAMPAPSPGDLLAERTILAVNEARRAEAAATSEAGGAFGGAFGGGWLPGSRLGDLIAVAAVLLIGVSVVVPSLNHSRDTAKKIASEANLAGAYAGLTSYARSNNNALPRTQFKAGDEWWHTNQFDEDGNAQSNSAHAFVLIRTGQVKPEDLINPANPNAPKRVTITMRDWANDRQISYSFQNVFTPNQATLTGGGNVALMADKNPLIMGGEFRSDLGAETAISTNHRRLGGQHVLTRNGQVLWLTTPYLDGDNIWTAGETNELHGDELPTDEFDSFLVQ